MQVSDIDLINKWIKESDSEAFAEIVKRHSGMVYGTCVRMLGDAVEAEDVTQDCFVKLGEIRNLAGTSLRGLLHTLATHLSLNKLRAQSRQRQREIAFALNAKPRIEVDWDDVRHHVDEAIADLAEKHRYPIISHFLEGQTYEAIASTLGIDESTVRYRIKKGVEQVRKLLKLRGIPVSAALLAGMLRAHMGEAIVLSSALVTSLGKLALAGRPELTVAGSAAGGVLGTSKLAVLGGTAVMSKHVSIVLGIFVLTLGGFYVLHSRQKPSGTPPDAGLSAEIGSAETQGLEPITTAEVEPGAAASEQRTDSGVRATDQTGISDDEWAAFVKMLIDNARSKEAARQATLGSAPPPYTSKDIPPDNGMHYFLLAAELCPKVDMMDAKWEELRANGFPDDPEFWAMLDKFQEAFDAIRTGLEVGNAAMPPWRSSAEDISYLARFRELARAMSKEAQYYAALGDYEASFDDYTTLLDFGSESSRGGVLISGLVEFAIMKVAAGSLRETLTWGGAASEDYRYLIEQMQTLDVQMNTAWEVMETEASLVKSWVDKELETGTDLRSLVLASSPDLEEKLGIVSDEQLASMVGETLQKDYLALADYFTLPYYEAQTIDPNELLSQSVMNQVLLPAMLAIPAQEARTRAEVRGTMLSAAIEFYRAEHDSYPPSLSDLAPNYISDLPEDPFSGEPFVYTPTESSYLLYSVGPDMRDDSGRPLDGSGAFPEREGDILLHGEEGLAH